MMESRMDLKLDDGLKTLFESGKRKGYLTFAQVNEYLPDDAVNPDKLDQLLQVLEEHGIELIEESEAEERESDTRRADAPDEAAGDTELTFLDDDDGRRIDDPVRMYLTQMGEIPLLKREEEIALAKKIEVTRKRFRRKVLECDYALRNVVETLKRVHCGDLPFDRTVKVSLTENLEKDKILQRMPHNLRTLEHLMELNVEDFKQLADPRTGEDAKKSLRRQPAAGGVDRQEVPQPRPVVPGPDPGGQHGTHAGGGQVRVPPRLQVLDVRDLVDPAGDHAGDRRPGPDDPHPGAHDRDDVEAAQRLEEAAAGHRPGADDRGDGQGGGHLGRGDAA